jgi:hypothetical protein
MLKVGDLGETTHGLNVLKRVQDRFIDTSIGAAFGAEHLDRRSVVNGNIFNRKGVHVGLVTGDAVFGLKGQKLGRG